jgi:starch synthase
MKILFVSAEAGPYVTVGGLSQVSFFLPASLTKLGENVRVFTPKFGAMDETAKRKKPWKLKMELEGLRVPVKENNANDDLICNVKSYESRAGTKAYFLENREYYELRANVFGYKDDHVRFLLMCKGCLEWLMIQKESGGWFPEIIHCNDWHTAYLIELARRSPRYKKIFAQTKIVLTVHNFVYQGNFDYKYCRIEDRDYGSEPLDNLFGDRLQMQNALLRGILYADQINTVSQTHAREVLTEEYGEGLQKILYKKRKKLNGILNGLDAKTFNPGKDKLLKSRFNAEDFTSTRPANKAVLQRIFGLPVKSGSFLMAFVGRLAQQKGMMMINEVLPHLLSEHSNVQIVVLGGGEEVYRRQLDLLQSKYPKQIGLHLMPNFKLPRKVFAGADVLLLPSMFEPGGIVALEALRYGSVPIVRRTGGLNDIVSDFAPSGEGNGFSFVGRDGWSLYGAVIKALTIFENKNAWTRLVHNCLESDFSWDYAAKEYQKWYRHVRIEG